MLLTVIFLSILLLFFSILFYCFTSAFAVSEKHKRSAMEIPPGDQYDIRKQEIHELLHAAAQFPFEEVSVTTPDGHTLYGRLYECAPGAPVNIMFHGYRSCAMRDFSGIMQLSMKQNHNVLLVDQRAHGKSTGRYLSFGIKERFDCMTWTEYVLARYGAQTKVVLTGLSMGASTVLMASALPLPKNVIGVVADCGYSSPEKIIKSVISYLRYPPRLTYFFVRLSGILFGGFDVAKHSIPNELAKTDIPILFVHGEDDRFVPCEMTLENYRACKSEKMLFTVPGAGHGISYLVDYNGYCRTLHTFFESIGITP